MALEIQLLGGFRVTRDGEGIEEWGSEQTKTLLKILVSEPDQVFLHDQLIEHLWPETEFDKALSFLRARIHNLRQVLEPEAESSYNYVQTCPGGYRFKSHATCTIDTVQLEQHQKLGQRALKSGDHETATREFERVLELYRGPYLPEDRYEEWAQLDRTNWQDIYVQSLIDLAECHAKQRQYRKAVELCRKAYSIESYKEDLYRQAMIYCYVMGNSNDALRIFQDLKRLISTDLNVEPDPQTEKLAEQIAAGYVPGIDEKYERPHLADLEIGPHIGKLPFAGRPTEYKALYDMFRLSLTSAGKLALIGGEIGVGKTRLVQEITLLAKQEYNSAVLIGRFTELAMMSPYQTLIEALKSLLSTLDEALLSQIPPLSTAVLAPWLTGINFPHRSIEDLPKLDPEQERLRFFEALTQLLLMLSKEHRPITIFLDDIQWADASTLDFLNFFFPRIEAHPILLVGTYRSEEVDPHHPLKKLIHIADRQTVSGHTLHLRLERLTQENIYEILKTFPQKIEQMESLSQYLYEESSGNPLYLVSLLQTLVEEKIINLTPIGDWEPDLSALSGVRDKPMPREIQEMIQTRIERLDHDLSSLLECASVIGPHQDKALLRDLWWRVNDGDTELAYVQKIDALEKLQVISSELTLHQFVHDKIREVVYKGIHADRVSILHRCVAELLEEGLAPEDDRPYELFAYHYKLAGQTWHAVQDLLPAVENAVAGFQNLEGLAIASEALSLSNTISDEEVEITTLNSMRFDLLEQRISLLDLLAKREEQAEDVKTLNETAHSLEDAARKAKAHLITATYNMRISEFDTAQAEGYKALQIAQEHDNKKLVSRALHSIAQIAWHKGDYNSAHDYYSDELKVLNSLDQPSEFAQTLHYLGQISWHRGEYEESERLYKEALEIRERNSELSKQSFTLQALGLMYSSTEQFDKAIETLEEVCEIASRIGDRRGQAYALGNLGLTCMNQGAYDLALEHLDRSSEILKEIDDRRNLTITLNNLGRVNLRLGRLKHANKFFEEVLSISEEIEFPDGQAYAQHNLALINIQEKNHDRAKGRLNKALSIYKASDDQSNIGSTMKDLGELALASGDYEQSLSHFGEALIFSKALKTESEQMLNHTNLARSHLAASAHDEALEHSEKAIKILESKRRSPHAPLVWYTHYQVMLNQKNHANAAEALSQAHDSLERLANTIQNDELRTSYLNNISVNQRILEAFGNSMESIDLSETEAYELLRKARWQGQTLCPYCECTQTRIHGHVSKSPEKRYLCTDCGKTFGDRTGTVFANSNLSMTKLFQALLIIDNMSEASSAKKAISEKLEIHPRTASNLHKKLAKPVSDDAFLRRLIEQLESLS